MLNTNVSNTHTHKKILFNLSNMYFSFKLFRLVLTFFYWRMMCIYLLLLLFIVH